MYTNLLNPNRSKQPTWEDLLDRQSKEKDYKRNKRENTANNFKKLSDTSKQENKNKKIVDLQKEFEQLKNKIRHVENKNERMLTQLRTNNADEEPIQDRSSPLLRENASRGRVSKESLGKPTRRPQNSLHSGTFQSEFLPQLTVTSQNERKTKNDMKYLVDAALSLKKKQDSFEKLITSKLRELAQRIVQTQQLSKLCTDFQTIRDTSAISEKQSSEIFNMKSKQLELIINELERDKNKLKNQNSQLRLEIEDQRSRHQFQKESFHKQIQDLRLNSMKKLSESQSKYQKLIIKHNQELEQVRRQCYPSLDTSRIWRQDQEKISKDNQVQMLKYQQQHLNQMIQQLRSELQHQKSRIITLTNQKDKAQFELQKLQLSYSVEDFNQELSTYKSENETMLSELKSIRRDKEHLESEINTLRRQNKEYLLKINKKDQFRIEIEQTYKSKLKEDSKLINTIREEKRKLEMETIQLKSFNKNLLSEKEKFSIETVNEIKKILEIEGDAVIRTILQNYVSNPHILALQVLRIIAQRKITEEQFRKKLIQRGIVTEKDCSQGVKVEFFAIENLWQQNRRLSREVEQKVDKLRAKEEQWEGERELIQSNGLKLKRTLDDVRKSHQEEIKVKNMEIQPFKQQENNKFNEMKSLILKSQSDKKQLQNKIKMMEIEHSNLNEIKQNLSKKKDKIQLEKQQIRTSLQKQIAIKQQRIKKLQADLRQNKQQYSRKKTELTMENKRLEFNLSEMQIKIQKANGYIEQKQIILTQKQEQLKKKKEDASTFQNQMKETAKKLILAENKMKVQEQELRDKIAEGLGLNSQIQELNGKIGALQAEVKQRSNMIQKQKLKTEQDKLNSQDTLNLMNQNVQIANKQLADKTKEMEQIQQKFKESVQEKNQLELSVEEQKQMVKEQQEQIENLKKRISTIQKQSDEKDEQIKAGIEEQNIHSYNLQEIKEFNTKKISKFENIIKELEAKNKILTQNNDIIQKQLSSIKLIANQQSVRQSTQNNQLAQRYQQTENRLIVKQKQLLEKQKQIEQKYKQILYLTTKMEAEKSRLTQFSSKLQQKQHELEEQSNDLKIQNQEFQTMKQLIKTKHNLGQSLHNSKARTNEIEPFKQDLKKEFILEEYDVSDNFEIGEVEVKQEGSPNAIIIEFFLRIKTQIEKIVYGEEISVEIFQVIPIEIQNQFQELLNTISKKVNDNQLSFIYIDQFNADTMLGDSIMEEFPELNTQVVNLKRRVSEQQKIIADLTSEKGHHEHTINQMTQEMEEIEEENQARFIGQLSILKQQLKEGKLKIDNLEIVVSATRKTLFNVLQILVSEEMGLEEDLAESLNYYNNVTKASEKQKKQLASYFDRYVAKVK